MGWCSKSSQQGQTYISTKLEKLDGNASAPVILWLQGGPGSSSLFGLFTENGPYIYSLDNQLERRQYSWSNKHHLIYIDNPVGTGCPQTAWLNKLSELTSYCPLVPFCPTMLATHCPTLDRAEIQKRGEKGKGHLASASLPDYVQSIEV
uniref:Uncharacterized protein n=1 Tax=Timema bartmani TaxID=61472 RepID=A0A7R9F6W3_9NEOP|nr:unnamed protein product [Timema bartmani]